MSRFRMAAERIKKTPMVIPLTLVFLAMLVISLITSYEDFTTSRLGYLEIPTRKANPIVIYAVALIPQVGQIGFAYAYGREWKTSKSMAMLCLLVALGLHFVDVGTDMVYKASGMGIEVWVLAFIESELLYTLGSEVMLTISFGMLLYLMPEMIAQLALLAKEFMTALGEDDDDSDDSYLGINFDNLDL